MFKSRWLAATATMLTFATSALAGFTTIGSPTAGQFSQEQILEGIYGVDFAQSGRNFSASNIQVTRLQDFPLTGAQGLRGSPAGQDQLWTNGTYIATAKARFAPIPGAVNFGIFPGSSGGSYQSLFDVSGFGLDVGGSSGTVDGLGQTWRWGENRTGPSGTNNFSSAQADNGGKDFMAAYRVTGLADESQWTTWLLFWENTYGGTDRDFNDLVVEVKAATIPAPGAIALGILGLTLVGCYQRRRIVSPTSM